MTNLSIWEFLNERRLEVTPTASKESFLESRLFQMVLSGDAKLPLDLVEEVAELMGCDKHQLFRMAMRQFYDDKAISLFERMLGSPVTDEEQKWLHEIRSAVDGPVSAPSGMAKRLVRALAKPNGSE
ncbi:hypothetical protein AC244_21770 [Ensifer adhaerens]|uniref:Uncharacterized protein n=1 Tax=Ensifer adhaerens TaxID=106592 RepID=A0A0L8BMY5_ENSAD|nr:hypothetical protein [Ensifer adhaerens]KOF16036.1 hypothetical protein AC244_21770 [Ensifer adhaerens]